MRGLKPLQAYSEGKPLESHLLQMRGLKLLITPKNISLLLVASFTDAWIETTIATRTAAILKSHLLQMRGLKLFSYYYFLFY